ncbi:MAG: Flp pilus assembly complex ATPase component TadA, partial [Bdellovibrionales bacterium]|nr:Flp pilus assembly complex ATPase component TadA [Bdellovibrionales bacterium]
DPDIIMVGEIRDLETAKVAYKAASTGHLVVSTLHTNDAASTVARLVDMGVPNFLVAEATTMVVAQRLMRKNCEYCSVEYNLPDEVLLGLGVKQEELPQYKNLKKGEGCSHCNETGLAGRIAVHEVLQIKGRVKEAIFKEATPLTIKREALRDGMQTLRMSALNKLKKGITTVDEVLNATLSDDIL